MIGPGLPRARWLRGVGAATVVGLALTAPAGAAPAKTPKAIVLGIDGGTADELERQDLPALQGIAERGLYSRTTLAVPPLDLTVSGVGWATMATGVWPDKHDVHANSWPDSRLARYPSVLDRLSRTDARLRTAGFAVWGPMVDEATPGLPILGTGLDVREQLPDDVALGRRVGAWIRDADVDATFLQFDDVDQVGHGTGSSGPAYAEQLRRTDAAVGAVLAGIRARPTYAREDWLVIVSSDHGHNPEGGHGGPRPRERTTYVLAQGGRVRHEGGGLVPGGSVIAPERKLVDIAPSVLDHLGITAEPSWELDGRPFWTPDEDPFDTLAQRLAGGVTDTPPPGWSTTGGWRFGTDPWWTETFDDNPVGDETPNVTNNPVHPKEIELDERENFLDGRGVRAIADPAAAGGTLDASLTSPGYDVAGARTATVRFSEAYRGTRDQAGEVLASFDGGPTRVLATRAPTAETGGSVDISGLTVYAFQELKGVLPVPLVPELVGATGQGSSKVQQGVRELDVAVPTGARELRLTWRLRAAGSGWFWAVDEPAVTRTPARDAVRPRLRGLRILLRRGLSYDLSERAAVRIAVSHGGRRVATLRRSGRQGRNLHRLPRRLLRTGRRYRVAVTAVDAAGNRSARPVRSVTFRFRGGP